MEILIILGMVGPVEIVLILFVLVGLVFIFRLIGAWMLRINEIITLQKDILNELHHIHKELKREMESESETEKSK